MFEKSSFGRSKSRFMIERFMNEKKKSRFESIRKGRSISSVQINILLLHVSDPFHLIIQRTQTRPQPKR